METTSHIDDGKQAESLLTAERRTLEMIVGGALGEGQSLGDFSLTIVLYGRASSRVSINDPPLGALGKGNNRLAGTIVADRSSLIG